MGKGLQATKSLIGVGCKQQTQPKKKKKQGRICKQQTGNGCVYKCLGLLTLGIS